MSEPAIRQKSTITLSASAHCPSHSRADVSLRDLSFSIDEPTARGGTNMGPTPTDTALAALIGCTNVIGHKCADALGIDIGELVISANCDFDRRGVTLSEEVDVPFQKIVLTVTAHGKITQEALDQVAADVSRYCPLSKLFKSAGTQLEEHWLLATS